MQAHFSTYLKPIMLVAMLAALLGACIWLTTPGRFPIQHVYSPGEFAFIEKETVKEVVQAFELGNFFSAPLGDITLALENLPWIEQAKIKRTWPDTLTVFLREQKVIAYWNRRALVTPEGELFYPEELPVNKNWILLSGPDGEFANVWLRHKEAKQVIGALPGNLTVSAVELSSRKSWILVLNNNLEIRLGKVTKRQFVDRLTEFKDAFELLISPRLDEIAYIDLRYDSGLAIGWNANAKRVEHQLIAKGAR